MNKRLITSWLHAFMVVALIAIGFAVFEGISFYSGGNFELAFIGALICSIVVGLCFFIPQQLKAWAVDSSIWWERFSIILIAPLSLLLVMFPISHFLRIQRQEPMITRQFISAIDTAQSLFTDYEFYAIDRMRQYDNVLHRQKVLDRHNKMKGLRLQLLSANYDTLQTSALQWIETSIQDSSVLNGFLPTTLNVFLFGNIEGIERAVTSWNQQLTWFTEHRLSDEPEDVIPFAMLSPSVKVACNMLDDLRCQYRQFDVQQLWHPLTILWFLVLYGFLMLPYIFQSRHSKRTLSLFKSGRVKENLFMFYWEK